MKSLFFLFTAFIMTAGNNPDSLLISNPQVEVSQKSFSLPTLQAPPVAEIATANNQDAFGLPAFWKAVQKSNDPSNPQPTTGARLANLISKLPVRGVLPGKEIVIGQHVVTVGERFAVKEEDSQYTLMVKEVTPQEVVFLSTFDKVTYRYQLPNAWAGPQAVPNLPINFSSNQPETQ
jgi:hypothetical protein